jgi:CRISPR-associated protein Csh2
MGRTLHVVEPRQIKGTSVFASKEGNVMGTFREEHLLPYGLIAFYGIVNENAAQHTGLLEEDIQALQDGLWNGTLNLITRSKAGQIPRLLLRVEYNEGNFHMGGLDRMVVLEPVEGKDDRAIRSPKDYTLNANVLIEKLKGKREVINKIILCEDADVQWKGGQTLKEKLEGALGKNKIQQFDPNDKELKVKKGAQEE